MSGAGYARVVEIVEQLLAASRPVARQHFRTPLAVTRKADCSPVTEADRAIEQAMKAVLQAEVPGHGILGEEFGLSGAEARYIWVLDPIDGTKSFISGVPLFGTLIALLEDGVPVLGVIDMPMLGETWIGQRDGAGRVSTRFNGASCHAGRCTELSEAILFATSPDQFTAQETRVFETLSAACAARRFGGDCYSYGLLASGHIDLILEAELQPYDYLALVPVVEGAGGVITDWQGRALTLQSSGQVLAAATPALHAAALARLAGKARAALP
ncbi:histidinol-phosphatase [Pseudooceanicola nanhaiensis]|uniref:histidinol-phosphatase n=1 Tax=Pseudooceanicola nanhaiensis TaxID=375761 RepID=UPI001CD7D61F|nr:histidinol-phosphatase [Pseudooceanicola nanhaiensis]MCA0922842.1 histidinol-phosphatase [Pseudooceanicola nanhaiensis]